MKHLKMNSPIGVLTIVASDRGLSAVLWEKEKEGRVRIEIGSESQNDSFLLMAKAQLDEFFAGTRTKFDLKLDMMGTDFQKKVWQALTGIPYGQTASYLDIARKIGKPSASRAVGMANSKNPISIIVPCHRVIGASGKLTGYAGGLDSKKQLLDLEASVNC